MYCTEDETEKKVHNLSVRQKKEDNALDLDIMGGCKHPERALEFQFSFFVLYMALRMKQWNLSQNRSRLSLLM